ncbi:Pollen allergen ole e [Trema orientale]|uniref:Pollen allergen ole e n=1 Tax=Trema orientale TaxID=63057 RepID=A0A2P5FAX7_TREOI|nr:Pollen allergen ole e [Trema orientale]
MANKFVAVFAICVVVFAALNVREAEAADPAKFKDCFTKCEEECRGDGNGHTFCEVKCDSDCGAKEAAEKLNINLK